MFRNRFEWNHWNFYQFNVLGDFTWDSFDFGDGGAPADGKFYDPKRIEVGNTDRRTVCLPCPTLFQVSYAVAI